MCGRYYIKVGIRDIMEHYFDNMTNLPAVEYEASEIFPSDKVPVIHRGKEVDKTIHLMKWGFAPSYMKTLMINARSETIAEKKMFKEAFFRRRCLIPATGYYEWEKVETESGKTEKIKRDITVKGSEIISLAGIYDRFRDKDGQYFWAVSILTKEASDSVKNVHDRMPVIIDKGLESEWIKDYQDDYSALFEMIKSSSPKLMVI